MTELAQPPARLPSWAPAAGVLLAAGWGSNQFTPMLIVYHRALRLSTGTLEAMFGLYALGLIPGLLVCGSLADARGRRPVAVAAAALSLAATLTLIAAGRSVALLFAARALAGLGSGAAFSAGTAWLRELSVATAGAASAGSPALDQAIARRTAVAMTAGFAGGPLVAGLLAQWAPSARVVPYLPHVALMLLVLAALPGAPETRAGARGPSLRAALPALRAPRWRWVVAPVAPWVFAAPAIAFALLPSVLGVGRGARGVALTAAVTALCALAGVLVQPLARRLGARPGRAGLPVSGLAVATAGLLLAALSVAAGAQWLLAPCAVLLGTAYGLCLVAGLTEIQRLADPAALGGLSALFYTLTYVGFTAPYLLSLARAAAGYATLLLVTAALALACLVLVACAPRRAR